MFKLIMHSKQFVKIGNIADYVCQFKKIESGIIPASN